MTRENAFLHSIIIQSQNTQSDNVRLQKNQTYKNNQTSHVQHSYHNEHAGLFLGALAIWHFAQCLIPPHANPVNPLRQSCDRLVSAFMPRIIVSEYQEQLSL